MFLFISFVGVGNKGKQLVFLCQEDMFKQKTFKKNHTKTQSFFETFSFEIWRKSVKAFLFDTFLLTAFDFSKVADLKTSGCRSTGEAQ